MSVVVHPDEPIEQALRRLHREVLRENVIDEHKKRRYHIKESEVRSEKRREYQKRKRRHRRAVRKLRSKVH